MATSNLRATPEHLWATKPMKGPPCCCPGKSDRSEDWSFWIFRVFLEKNKHKINQYDVKEPIIQRKFGLIKRSPWDFWRSRTSQETLTHFRRHPQLHHHRLSHLRFGGFCWVFQGWWFWDMDFLSAFFLGREEATYRRVLHLLFGNKQKSSRCSSKGLLLSFER